MVASIVNHTVTSSTGADIIMACPEGVEDGDLLVFILTIGAVAAEAATIVFPSTDWREHIAISPVTGTGVRVMQGFKYASESEDPTFTFTYSASRPMIGTLIAIRGTQRDYDFDPTNYPYGYFAPAGPTLASVTDTAVDTITPTPLITTAVAYTLGIYLFVQYDAAAGSPRLDDPSPLVEILHRTQTTLLATLAMEVLYDDVGLAPAITAVSTLAADWVAVGLAVESLQPPDSVDNYKSKLLRRTMPPPYDQRLSSNLGKLLTVIGTSDNEIGGLFGEDDFLPDEVE